MPNLPYYDHIDPGQGGVSLIIPDTPAYDPSVYQHFPCRKCPAEFSSYEAWFQHRFEVHPFKRPVLFIGIREITTPRLTITTQLKEAQVRIANASKYIIDGCVVNKAQLINVLTTSVNGFLNIELIGDEPDLQSRYEISIEIPSRYDLEQVEAEFQRSFRVGVVSVVAINQFINNSLGAQSARRYLEGLAAYLYGILAKDQKGETHLTQEQGRIRMNEALQNLADFERPLASTISSLINFQMNVFGSGGVSLSAPRLNRAIKWFRQAQIGGDLNKLPMEDSQINITAQIPLDQATNELLEWIEMPLANLGELLKVIERRAQQDNWLPEDRMKAKVVATIVAEHSGNIQQAAYIARSFRHDPVFGSLAERLIEKSKELKV
jgi:hypothetical protein